MTFPRAAGVLLHPTSLPGPNGIGELGPDALRFLDLIKSAGLTIWQMLPLGPTGYGNSPYQCFSAFAGNPLLIHLPGTTSTLPTATVDFPAVIAHKQQLLATMLPRLEPDERFHAFVAEHAEWLEDYALFMAIKSVNGGSAWTSWNPGLATRDLVALETFRAEHTPQVHHYRMEQYVFFRQFDALRKASGEHGIRLMGDMPMYVAHDSADVWANRNLFQLDDVGQPSVQAGVPPDYFSDTGQLWGNPLYDWTAMREQDYRWWTARMKAALRMFDMVRIDHFRGFESYWEVPASASTAAEGRWVPGPGAQLFDTMTAELGPLPIVAENLGLITPEVESLRTTLGYPGMSVLQFAFGAEDAGQEHQPHMFPRNHVVYTGTHDNDTAIGWWNANAASDPTLSAETVATRHAHAMDYLGTEPATSSVTAGATATMHWPFIRAALASVADTALIPMQDILGLGTAARMNFPGRPHGNWEFRFQWDQATDDTISKLQRMTQLFDRRPKKS